MEFRIPRPFEIGAVASVAERGIETAFLDNEAKKWQRFGHSLLKIASDQLAMNPIPQIIKPMVDVYANKDSFTGRPIESMGMENQVTDYRFTANTSLLARGLSTAGQSATQLIGKNFLSPVQIDHLARGYFAWLGATSIATADLAVRYAVQEKDRPTMDYWKLATGGMVAESDGASSRYVSQMYDQATELEQAYHTWHSLLKEGKTEEAKAFREDHRDELGRYKSVEAVKRQESKFNEMIKMIERSTKTSDEKRDRIREIQKQKDQLARRLAA